VFHISIIVIESDEERGKEESIFFYSNRSERTYKSNNGSKIFPVHNKMNAHEKLKFYSVMLLAFRLLTVLGDTKYWIDRTRDEIHESIPVDVY
jgi:hypothetical protein